MKKDDVELERFSQTIPCTCGRDFKLMFNPKRKVIRTVCKCGKNYGYILKVAIDTKDFLAKEVMEKFWE